MYHISSTHDSILCTLQNNEWVIATHIPSSIPFVQTSDTMYCWVYKGDLISTGGIPTLVDGFPNLYGKKIHKNVVLYESYLPDTTILYHGTDSTNISSIQSNGFYETSGMLGKGVYLGSYWKACRYACLQQNYMPRSTPAVIRTKLLNNTIFDIKDRHTRCNCKKCSEDTSITPFFVDHESLWHHNTHTIFVDTCQRENGTYIVKNPEYCTRSTNIQILDAVYLLPAHLNIYNPLDRNISFV